MQPVICRLRVPLAEFPRAWLRALLSPSSRALQKRGERVTSLPPTALVTQFSSGPRLI